MGTARRFRVSLNDGVRTRFFSFLLVGVSFPLGMAALAAACAKGGGANGDTAGEGGDEATLEGGEGSIGEGGAHEGGGDGGGSGTTAMQACNDNAAHYCAQLAMCSDFLLQVEYGDPITCQTEIVPGCLDALAAPDESDWGAQRQPLLLY